MKTNIWLMNHYASDMYRDKSGRHFWFARKLKQNGYQTTIFCANTYHNKPEFVDTEGKKYIVKYDGGIPYYFVKTVPSEGNGFDRLKNIFFYYKNLFPAAMQASALQGKPDVILASSVHPLTMVAGIQIARRLKVPCICEIRDLWPEAIFFFSKLKESSMIGKLLIAGEHWIYQNADALIFTKEGDTDYLKERAWTTAQGGDVDLKKCYYINNGVNLDAFDRSVKEHILQDEELNVHHFRIIYAGIIRPVNNVGNILDAAKLLNSEMDIEFLIYGDGSQLGELRTRLEVEHIQNVKLKGFVERKYIPYILSRSSINILNYSQSQYNWSRGNSSNKLFEYMASGKPIISTVKMGYDLISRYDCGVSLVNCNPQSLADAILSIKNMSEKQYGAMCRNARRASEDFDFDILTKKLIDVVDNTLKVTDSICTTI